MEFIDLKTQYHLQRREIDARIQKVLDHGHYIMGPEVQELEERLADYTGAKYCITVASGTEALLIALMAIDIRPGDEVITTPFTFIATAEAIVLLGAVPVFADIDEDTCNIDPARLRELITPRTRAILPVSLYGQPADMDEINAIAAEHGVVVIEDAAQSFGATYKGKKSCNLSDIGCTSFFPSKPLGCYGDGGAIFTSDESLCAAMREIRVHGQSRRYYHTRIGVGGRMDTLQCAVVLAKLPAFEEELRQRRRVGAQYNTLLGSDVDWVRQRPDRESVYAQYTIRVPQRDDMLAHLARQQIPTAVHYPVPVPLQPAYSDCSIAPDIAIAERMAARVLSLPMGPYLDLNSVERVVNAVLERGIRRRA